MNLPYVERVYVTRWRRRYLVPHVTVRYDRCDIDDAAWRDGTSQRADAAHRHQGWVELVWMGVVVHARWPSSGRPKVSWCWP